MDICSFKKNIIPQLNICWIWADLLELKPALDWTWVKGPQTLQPRRLFKTDLWVDGRQLQPKGCPGVFSSYNTESVMSSFSPLSQFIRTNPVAVVVPGGFDFSSAGFSVLNKLVFSYESHAKKKSLLELAGLSFTLYLPTRLIPSSSLVHHSNPSAHKGPSPERMCTWGLAQMREK